MTLAARATTGPGAVVGGTLLGWLLAVGGGRALSGHDAGWLVATVLLAVVGAATLAWRRPSLGAALLAGLGVLLAVLPYERALGATPFAWGGLDGDQAFRTEYLARFAASPALADYTYQHLPAFYPPAWFWVVGRVAAVMGTPAWQVLRPATTLTVPLMVSAATLVAAPAVGRRTAAVTAGVAAAFGAGFLWEPYCLLADVLVLALLLRLPGWLARGPGRPRWWATAWLSTGFAAVFLCYTYGAALLVLTALATAALGRPVRARLLLVAGAGAAALLATAWYWLPGALVSRPPGPPAQVTWLSEANSSLPWRLFWPTDPARTVALVGLLWVLVRGGLTPEGRAVRVFLGVAAGWCAVSVALSSAAGVQLQPNRIGELAALVCCGCVGLAVRDAAHSQARGGWRATRVGAALAAVGVLAGSGWAAVGWAAERSQPGAVAARAQELPTRDARVAATLESVLGRPAEDLVVVSGWREVLSTTPLHGFQQWNETYANPAADFRARERHLRAAFASRTPAELASRLRHTRWGPIDALVLIRSSRGYSYRYVRQDDEGHDVHVQWALPGRLVAGPAFRVLPQGDGLVLILPR